MREMLFTYSFTYNYYIIYIIIINSSPQIPPPAK